jgi:two-component system CheB/CheR fusion protein
VGRPLGHLTSKLVGHDKLVDEVKAVIDTLVPTELEVQSLAGDWFLMRIRPYRTLKNVIEGAVVVFLDINELARTRAALKAANETARLAVVVRDASDAITVQDLEGRTLAWNPAAERLYGWTEAEALQLKVRDRTPPGLQAEELEKVLRLGRAEVLLPWSTQRLTRQGAVVEITLVATALLDEAGRMYAVATTERRVEPALARGAG